MKLRCLIPLFLVASFAARASTLLVSDTFTDGSRSNTNGGDLLGLVYYMGQTSSTLTVTNDSAGIGSGNALLLTPSGGFNRYLAYFGPVALTNAGDSLMVGFDFRFASQPTNLAAGYRVGLYNSMGTRQTNDASDTGVPGPGDRSDDLGYGFQTNPGSNSTTGLNIYSEAAGNDILGGASPSQTANQGAAGASFDFGTTKHHCILVISLQPGGSLGIAAQVDFGVAGYASIPAGSVLTTTFDEFGNEDGGTGNAVPWLIDNLTILKTDATDFDPMRTNWWKLQTGGGNYSLSDNLVKSQLSIITNNALGYWNSMDKTGTNTYLWSDLTSTTDSSQISTAYTRLDSMALAYATVGSALRTNAALAADIQTGLNWMYTNRYNVSIPATSGEYDNWYDWEIGAPLVIVDLSVYMYDALGITGLSNTLAAVDHFVPSPFSGTSGTSTGGNLTDKTRVVAVRGALVKDSSKLFIAQNAFSSLFQYVTSGDGYYADGSYIQHTHHPYNGSYGLVAIQDTSLVLPWLVGSPWQSTDPAQSNVVQWVYNNYQPFLYYGAMMDMTRGRAMSRYSDEDHTAGGAVMEWLLELGVSSFPASADAKQIQGIVKYLAQVDTFRNFTNNVPIQLITSTEQMMSNAAIPPRGELFGHWTFGGMDQVVHLRPGWGAAVSMSSSRVYNYESINSENLHGWFQGDGATYIYTSNDLGQFNSNFWPTVDPYSLPGTTADTTALANSAGQSSLTPNNWVGGVTLFTNGAAGLDLQPANNPLTAKKSWFMFDDEIACLGAGITDTSSADVQTAALNRKISTSNTNNFSMNGTNRPTTLGWTTNLANTTWCSLDGFGGLYFPGGAAIKALRQTRTNSWSQINSGGTTSQNVNNFVTLWFDHGIRPVNSSYAYVMLPNFTSAQSSNYAISPKVTILENTTNAQAVKDTALNVVAANFWGDTNKTIDLITVNHRSAVMTQQGATLAAAVSDPTQTNTAGISVTLNVAGNSVASADPAITITQLRPTIQFSVNTSNGFGRSYVAIFNTSNSPPIFTSSLVPVRNVGPGVTLRFTNTATDPDLPWQTLSFSMPTGPTNATLDPVTGIFNWRAPVSFAGTTNPCVIVISDNGSPIMSATQSFSIVVNALMTPTLSPTVLANGQVNLLVSGSSGPDYTILGSSNLVTWTNLFVSNNATVPFTWTDTNAHSFSKRFYRLLLGP